VKTSSNTVLITGGATGIGLALAKVLVAKGNSVAICGRRRSKLLAAKRSIPQLLVKVCDVSKTASMSSLLQWLERRLPSLNILVNNAGIQRSVNFLKGPRDLPRADEELATNLRAPIHLAALLIPILEKQTEAAIVNISSGLGFTPLAQVPVYCATKAAIHSLSLSLRRQLRSTHVRVFEIAPPIVPTELAGRRRRPDADGYTMSANEVAQGIVMALASDTYEVALGAAANLYEQRDRLFEVIND
jgi:uncharacterized oxidoreductase